MNVHIITVGDELLIGQVINTNASWLGEHMIIHGAHVLRSVTLPDDQAVIEKELRYSSKHADLIIVTGGLGPTHDDVTREAIASFLGVPLQLDRDVLRAIEARFEKHNRIMPERNRVQALVPDGCTVLKNRFGTAPGLRYRGAQFELFVLPGVPHEMKGLIETHVIPIIREDARLKPTAQRTLHTLGIGESHLQELIGDLNDLLLPGQKLAYLPGLGGVRLRITATGQSDRDARAQIDTLEAQVYERVGDFIFGVDQDLIESKVGHMLQEAGLTLATAESCTGGLIGDQLTNISGSSAYFKGGVIAYCNEVKRELLAVEEEALVQYGAVSEPVAIQMARGVRQRLHSDIGVSATGIMGPTGGTPDKPIGLVWIGYSDAHRDFAERILIHKERRVNKRYTAIAALRILWHELKRIHQP